MTPKELKAELSKVRGLPEGLEKWQALGPLILEAIAAMDSAVERLTTKLDEARAEIARLTTPRPIEEAPKDGTPILGLVDGEWRALWWWDDITDGARWHLAYTIIGDYRPTHFLPLPVKP